MAFPSPERMKELARRSAAWLERTDARGARRPVKKGKTALPPARRAASRSAKQS